jgi:DNA polymerase elongation subunit (family B)
MRTLLLDIETRPILGYTWGTYEQNVIAVVEEWTILSVAYKWLGEKKVTALGAYNDLTEEDILLEIHEAMSEADIVVAHNGDKFDIKKLNARFIRYGLDAPEPYKTIDTLKVARKYFAFTSNRLNELGKFLGVGEKAPTGGFELWQGCMDGDLDAWKKMLRYNKQDVVLLEKIYLKLRPYMTNHPNINVIDETSDCCPTCSSTNIQKRGFGMTTSGKYQRYQCTDCGSWSKGKSITTVNTRA